MTEWTPKQHIEHQKLLERMERERLNSKAEPVSVPRKKKRTKKQAAK